MLERDPVQRHEYANDFSQLNYQMPNGVYIAESVEDVQEAINQATMANQALTIRCHGLSQGGQSVAVHDGFIMSVAQLKGIDFSGEKQIWVSAGNTWEEVLDVSLQSQYAPMALPYNCQLSVGGVLSAGGMGSGAFKYGPMIAHVEALEIVDGRGNHGMIGPDHDCFQAMLGGQGNFGVIIRACMRLRPVKQRVKTWFLLYDQLDSFFNALTQAKLNFDYIESFCSVSMQGAIRQGNRKKPLTHWLYGLHVSLEYDQDEPDDHLIDPLCSYARLGVQTESIQDYFLRHNHRFEAMRGSGQWSMMHPWYECYIDQATLTSLLPQILADISPVIAPLIHVIPIEYKSVGMIMFPEKGPLFSFMILNPGLPHYFKPQAIETLHWLNELFLSRGGKRYLSGYQGDIDNAAWWQAHFGEKLPFWKACKQRFDPNHVFQSKLFHSILA